LAAADAAADTATLLPVVPLLRQPVCCCCCFFLWKGATAAIGSPAWPLSSSTGTDAATAATEDAMSWVLMDHRRSALSEISRRSGPGCHMFVTQLHPQDLGEPLDEEEDEVLALQLIRRCELHQVGQQL
jgi:hypothetical protein